MMRFDNKLILLYRNAPLRYKAYTVIRSAICPLIEIERYIPEDGKILDFGCGHGIFANLLAMKSKKRYVIGMDIMESKIEVANSTLFGRRNIEFRVGGIEKSLCEKDIKCITLMDILCYIPFDKKIKLLQGFYNLLPDGGTLIIKSTQETLCWKYWWTLFHMATIDKIIHKSFKANSYFLKKRSYLSLLKDIGFEVEFEDLSKGYPYPHCLYICNKSGENKRVS